MHSLSFALYGLVSFGTIIMAAKYLFGEVPTFYHREILRRDSIELTTNLELVFIGLGRTMGAALLASGVSVFLFSQMITPDAMFVIKVRPALVGLIIGVPSAVIPFQIENTTGVRTPWRVSAALSATLVMAFLLSLM